MVAAAAGTARGEGPPPHDQADDDRAGRPRRPLHDAQPRQRL